MGGANVNGKDVFGGFLVPEDMLHSYYRPYTRRERIRNVLLRILRRPIPERKWIRGLLERLADREVLR